MFQSEVEGRIVDWGLLTNDVRPEFSHDLDYLISMLDWDANVNPEFAKSKKTKPRPVKSLGEMQDQGLSTSDPLVMLKHLGPGNADAQLLVKV
ncbi:MAG TPA: hypothetical protein VFE27_19510 [Acidobacteriaceae bacterium]|jgi:hypothetical protein|nr:hypothetical protein [Acidobacteriaceae bacterium]